MMHENDRASRDNISNNSSQTYTAFVRKLILLPPLVFALYMIKIPPSEKTAKTADALIAAFETQGRYYPAFLWALRAHPPSRRVFRGLFEYTLLLYCTSFCLRVWERVFDTRDFIGRPCFNEKVGTNMVGHLLFQPAVRNGGVPAETGEIAYAEVDETQHDDAVDEGLETTLNNNRTSKYISSFGAQIKEESSSIPTLPVFYPPKAIVALNAAMDMTLLMVFCLFLFTLGSVNLHMPRPDDAGASLVQIKFVDMISKGVIAAFAPAFPLILFAIATMRTIIPWSKRKGFWTVLFITMEAPFQSVTFRDGFVGDILTSTVRPLQDLAFTTFYIISGLQGWWSSLYSLDEAAAPVEHSWLLRTVILPACMISPLWWRFLQNLRQAYDNKQRWPYLGNALKYMVAAEVALFGVFDPSAKQKFVWLLSFTAATLYQVWWDTFMDWELLELVPEDEIEPPSKYGGYGYEDAMRRRSSRFAAFRRIIPRFRLRPKRIYPEQVYYSIFVINFLLRFCWTLSFIPPSYLSRSGEISQQFSVGIQHFFSPFIASTEIIRRSLWGLIRLELEAFKVEKKIEAENQSFLSHDRFALKRSESDIEEDTYDMTLEDMQPMTIGKVFSAHASQIKPRWFQNDMSHMSETQILMELCLWATAFTSLGIFAAAHREVL